MASPIGHALGGLAVGRLSRIDSTGRGWRWYAFAFFCVNAADLDFLVGLILGDVNRFHRSASHSLVAALLFGVAVAALARLWTSRWRRAALTGTLLYLTHLALDFLSGKAGGPSGQPILWPFRSDSIHWPWPILPGIEHGAPMESFKAFVTAVCARENLEAVLIEAAILAPLLWLSMAISGAGEKRKSKGDAPSHVRSPEEHPCSS